MAPFKKYFTGEVKPPHSRIATCQKCMRTPDIERVGRTARHCTFFEMLGNFSFGDYFKEESIQWAWEFVTEILELPVDDLWVTVYVEDDEAYEIWNKKIGVPESRIVRLGKKDNFWEIGTGPCGPCSEIYIDRGEKFGCGEQDCKPGCDCDRYLEFWNLVFTQYDLDESGNYNLLENKNIDTGMGLERIAAIMQDVPNVFEIDVFKPIISLVSEILGVQYGFDNKADIAIRVITEHARGVTFMIGDGVLPSNEGRGYVLRRILRRAVRYGKLMGIESNFLYIISERVIEIMAEAYPELDNKKDFIIQVIKNEEERFHETLNIGTDLLNRIMDQTDNKFISGEDAFRLYDTYGFPIELTQEIAEEQGFTVDYDSFEKHMQEQKEKARHARQNTGLRLHKKGSLDSIARIKKTDFVGYSTCTYGTEVLAILKDGTPVEDLNQGETGEVIVQETPFYAESGGQISDTGIIEGDTCLANVVDTRLFLDHYVIHHIHVVEGSIKVGSQVLMRVDESKRKNIQRNHSATHLLHYALRTVLGDHAKQSGSLVSDKLLRFDVSHYQAISKTQLDQIEAMVNEAILANYQITVVEKPLEIARLEGVIGLFDDKYGDIVRVVTTGDITKELCGGTHVSSTGEIGMFRITSESSIGAGLRRIEGITGDVAIDSVKAEHDTLANISLLLQVPVESLVRRVKDLIVQVKDLEKNLETFKDRRINEEIEEMIMSARVVNDVSLIVGILSSGDIESLRRASDYIRDKKIKAIAIIGGHHEDRANLVVTVHNDYIEKGYHAGKLIKKVAAIVDGSGGGRPDMAQAGGKSPEKLPDVLVNIEELISL